MAMIGPLTSSIALYAASLRREPRLDVALDVLDHDDRVVDHDADGEHQPEQRQRVDREAEAEQDANVPTIEIGTATSGMIEARQVCRNSTTTSTTSRMASNSVFDDLADRRRAR